MKPFYSILLILIFLLAAEGHCQTNQFDKQDDTSIYSFLKKNELTNKTEQEFYFTYADRAKAKELYSFFVENKLTTKDFDTFYNDNFSNIAISKAPITYKDFSARIKKKYPEYKDVDDLILAKKVVEKYPYYKDKVSFDGQQNSIPERSFKSDEKIYDIPENDVQSFLKDLPYGNEVVYPIVKLHQYLSKKDGFNVPLDQFKLDMQDEIKLKRLYYNLKEKDGFTGSLENFKAEMLSEEPIIYNGKSLYNFWLISPPEDKMKLIYDYLAAKNTEIKENGLETFANDMQDESKLKQVYDGISKKYPEWKIIGYDSFMKEMFPKETHQLLANHPGKTETTVSSFQIDKIRVGETFIDLPIPNGFVKVDDTMGILLEIAQKMCPETNTLLAYYISEEDYANYLVNQNHIIEKYIFVQVFNELKNTTISGKDYRKFVNDFKKQYVDEFKAIFDEAELKITDNFLKIDEDFKLDNFKMQPFGICYESKNSISYGILSKYDFLIDGDNSVSQIVAAISTIAKIDNMPIFLFAYKIYKSNEDIKSLKAMNSNWIQEIDRKQSPASFIADIDFEDYKEAILAILTLSFIWAIYFATKKIHKKIKEKAVSEELEVVEKNNLFDFDELLKEAGTTPNDLTYNEEIAGETLQEKEEIIAESTTVRNPELLKVGRRMRLLHFLIDMLFLYFIAYCSGYILVFIFGPSKALKIVEHTYLFGGSLAFIVYFSQEFIFGKTLGKLLTGTRVVDSLGNKPGIVKLIIRSASRLIPLEALSFLGSNKRGWHDTISDTFVIKD